MSRLGRLSGRVGGVAPSELARVGWPGGVRGPGSGTGVGGWGADGAMGRVRVQLLRV